MAVLVTGATGRVGRRVADQIVRAGRQVRALTRDPARASRLTGTEVVTGDLMAPETLRYALDGVTEMHLLAMAGEDSAPVPPEVVERAVDAGIRRITVLTGSEDDLAVLDAVKVSGVEWTHIRPMVEFMSNRLEWKTSVRSGGVVRAAFGDVPQAIVHEADIAAVAGAALLEDGHAGRTYTPTGPSALTPVDAAEIMGLVLGRKLRFEELSPDQAGEQMRTAGYSAEDVTFILEYMANPPQEAMTVSAAVEEATGHPPRSFAQWVAEHADAFD